MMKFELLATTVLAGALAAPTAAHADVTVKGFGGVTVGAGADDFTYQYEANSYAYEIDLDSGFVVGGAVGVSVSDFTIEVEGAFRSSDADVVLDATYYGDVFEDGGFTADFNIGSVLANIWYEVPLGSRFSIYGGGGLGVAFGDLDPGQVTAVPVGFSLEESEAFLEDAGGATGADFAWQIGAGAKYHLTEKLSVGVGYRYFNANLNGPEYDDSSILGEVSFRF